MKKLSFIQESFFIIPFSTVIMFCKPCSVPSYCKRLIASYSGGNHLSTDGKISICPSLRSFPSGRCPYHHLGFSLVGFTAFHL